MSERLVIAIIVTLAACLLAHAARHDRPGFVVFAAAVLGAVVGYCR